MNKPSRLLTIYDPAIEQMLAQTGLALSVSWDATAKRGAGYISAMRLTFQRPANSRAKFSAAAFDMSYIPAKGDRYVNPQSLSDALADLFVAATGAQSVAAYVRTFRNEGEPLEGLHEEAARVVPRNRTARAFFTDAEIEALGAFL